MRRSSVDTLSPRAHCFSNPDRSLAKPSASRCITAATNLSASSTVRRGSSTKPVWTLFHCDRKSPISDSENKGMGFEIAAALSRVSGSWPFTSLSPSGCFGELLSLATSAVGNSSSILFSSATTPPLSVPQLLVPAPVPQTRSGNESSPFSSLLYLPHFSQLGVQYHAQTGSFPRPWDDRQKCRPHVDRNRIPDSREFSSETTPGHPLLRLPLLGNRQNETVRTPTVSKNVRAPLGRGRECSAFQPAPSNPTV